jgi:hypothetical protein
MSIKKLGIFRLGMAFVALCSQAGLTRDDVHFIVDQQMDHVDILDQIELLA